MSREIDERIVAMYFDNKNFESGAQQTLKTLDELKKSMSFDGVGKGFEAFEQASKKLNLDKMSQSARKLKDTFSGVGRALTKSLKTVMSPLDNLKRSFREFNGIVTKVAGINIASKLVSGIEQTFRSLTIAPISAGWEQYNNTMDSVKTIMSSTGETIDVVKEKLNHMTNYANQTIYSLNDMTSNLGKFTNNGVKLDDATQAMIGLANATADAGQGAAQASMAMYNVSQAIGVGKMTAIDWKSLENANIATTKLKQTFIDAAVATGDLEKKMVKNKETGEEVVEYWTKAEKGAKAEQVTTEKFRDTLSKGWLTKEAMLNTFAIYSGELDWKDILQMGYTEEQAKQLAQIGKEAMEAATQVRTFKKMMDALKEGVQSTWATSFEYIFGDMEEGTALWTKLNEKVESVLEKSAKNRNDILLSWRGLMRDEDGNIRKVEEVYKRKQRDLIRDLESGYINYEAFEKMKKNLDETLGDTSKWVDYRKIMIDAIIGNGGLFDVLQNLAGTVSGAWEDVFGKFNADSLKQITQGFADLVKGVGEWLGSADDADSRLSKLRKGLSGVFSVLKVGRNILKAALTVGWNTIKPIIDPLLNLFAKFGDLVNLKDISNLGDMLKVLGERFKGLWDKLSKLGWKGIFDKIGTWMSDLWSTIKTGISTALSDFGLDGIVQWFVDIGDKIKEGWQTIENWWNKDGNVVRETFSKIWDAVTGLFTAENEGEDIPIVKFFKNIGSWIEGAWNTVKELPIWKTLGTFFTDLWNDVTCLFKPVEITGKMGNTWYKDSPIVAFFKGIGDSLTSAWETVSNLPIWKTLGDFFTKLWNDVTGLFKPVEITGKMGNTWYKDSPIVSFFKGIGDSLTSAWNTVSGLPIWETLRTFFSDLWNDVSSWFQPKQVVKYSYEGGLHSWYEEEKAPIVAFFDGIYSSISNIWEKITGWFETSGVKKFLGDAWAWIVEQFQPQVMDDGTVGKAPIVQFFEKIGEAIKTAWDSVVKWITDVDQELGISKFFTDAWGWIMDKLGIGGEDKNKGKATGITTYTQGQKIDPNQLVGMVAFSDSGSMGRKASKGEIDEDVKKVPVIDFLIRIKDALVQVWNDVTGWEGWKEIGQFFSDIWTGITSIFKKSDTLPDDTGNIEEKKSAITSIGEFIRGVFEALSETVQKIGTSAEAQALVKTVTDVLAVIKNIIEIVTEFMLRVTNTMLGKTENAMGAGDYVSVALGIAAYLFAKVTEWHKLSKMSSIAEAGGMMNDLGGQILKLAGGIALISFAIRYLGSIPTEQLIQGGVAILAILGVLGWIIPKVTALTSSLKNSNPVTSTERILGKLVSTLGMVGTVFIVMEKLPDLIGALSEAKKYSGLDGTDLLETFKGIFLFIGGLMVVLTLTNKIAPTGIGIGASIKTTIAAILSFTAIIGSIGLIATALANIVPDLKDSEGKLKSAAEIREKLSPMVELIHILGEMIGDFVGGILGFKTDVEKVQDTEDVAKAMAQVAESFDMERISGVLRIANMMMTVSETAKGLDPNKLKNLPEAMGHLGDALNKFAFIALAMGGKGPQDYIGIAQLLSSGDSAYERASQAIELVRKIVSVFEPLGSFESDYHFDSVLDSFNAFGGDQQRVSKFIAALNAIIDGFRDLHDGSDIDFDGINIVQKLYDSINAAMTEPSENLPTFDATPIVDAIIKAIGLEDTAIKACIHELIQSGINLAGHDTYDTSALNGTGGVELENLFSGMGIDNLFSGYNFDDQVNELTKGLDGAMDQADAAADKAFSKMKEKYANGAAINIMGITLDENFWTNFQTEMDQLQAQIDANEDYQLSFRPILNTTGFDAEVAKLQAFFTGDSLLSMNATVNLGEQLLPIDDEALVTALKDIRGEIKNHETAIESSIRSLETSLGNRITSLGYSVAKMKFVLDTGALAAALTPFVDKGLNDGANTSGLTGTNYSRPPVKIDYNINTPSGYNYVTEP